MDRSVAVLAAWLMVVAVAVYASPANVRLSNGDSQQDRVPASQTRLRTSMALIGDATNFLRAWFEKLRASLDQHSIGHIPGGQPRIKRSRAPEGVNIEKPEIKVNEKTSNESSFETYEKNFLINQTLNYLKQIYYYSKYRQRLRENSSGQPGSNPDPAPTQIDTTNDTNRVDALLSAKMNELSSLPLSELEKIFHSVRRAAQNGVEDPGITSVCCPQG